MKISTVLSLGYEQRTTKELLSLLRKHGVIKLLDVRQRPISRKPGFNKSALSKRLRRVGIEYRHLPMAGNPHRKQMVSMAACLRLYRRYLRKNPQVIELVSAEFSEKPVAILCYERLHSHCHRSVLLDVLFEHGHRFRVLKLE